MRMLDACSICSGTVVQWCSGAVVQWCSGAVVQWCSGAVVQWCSGAMARALTSRLREPGFKSCVAVSNFGQIVSLYIAPVHSAIYIYEYLAIDIDGYLCSNSLHALITECLHASQRS